MAFKLRNQNVKRVVGGKHPFAHSDATAHDHPHGGVSDIPTISQRQTTINQTAPSSDELVYDVVTPNLMQVDTSEEGVSAYNALTPEQRAEQDRKFIEINDRRAAEAAAQTEQNRLTAISEQRQSGGSETTIDTNEAAISDTSISQQKANQADVEFNESQIRQGVKDLVAIDAIKMGNQFRNDYLNEIPFANQQSAQSTAEALNRQQAGVYATLVGSGAYTPEEAIKFINNEFGTSHYKHKIHNIKDVFKGMNQGNRFGKGDNVITMENLTTNVRNIYKDKKFDFTNKKKKVGEETIVPIYSGMNVSEYAQLVRDNYAKNRQ